MLLKAESRAAQQVASAPLRGQQAGAAAGDAAERVTLRFTFAPLDILCYTLLNAERRPFDVAQGVARGKTCGSFSW
jgi:hypothetical protein